jgi:flagellar hook assembly protein FlgD
MLGKKLACVATAVALAAAAATAVAQAPVLTLSRAIAFPNPFDPAIDGPVTIRWEQSRDATDVTIEIYDFAGDQVARLAVGPMTSLEARATGAFWHGRDEDGVVVADGGYLAHIVAQDAGGRASTNVKIAVLRR